MNQKVATLTVITLLLSAAVFLLTIGDFLAYHDIRADYASPEVFEELGMTVPEPLPVWTETPTEWAIVGVSFYSRLGFLILNAITLSLCLRAVRGSRDRNDQPVG